MCDKVCQWLAIGGLFSLCTPVSSTNKSDPHDITEILLKVAFNIPDPPPYSGLGLRALQYNLFVGFVLLDLKKTVGSSLFYHIQQCTQWNRNWISFRSTWVHTWCLVGWFMLTDLLFHVYCFVDRCLFFLSFSFDHCIVCPSSIYGFWLPLWYLHALLNHISVIFSDLTYGTKGAVVVVIVW